MLPVSSGETIGTFNVDIFGVVIIPRSSSCLRFAPAITDMHARLGYSLPAGFERWAFHPLGKHAAFRTHARISHHPSTRQLLRYVGSGRRIALHCSTPKRRTAATPDRRTAASLQSCGAAMPHPARLSPGQSAQHSVTMPAHPPNNVCRYRNHCWEWSRQICREQI
jgi:hypothetical protein